MQEENVRENKQTRDENRDCKTIVYEYIIPVSFPYAVFISH